MSFGAAPVLAGGLSTLYIYADRYRRSEPTYMLPNQMYWCNYKNVSLLFNYENILMTLLLLLILWWINQYHQDLWSFYIALEFKLTHFILDIRFERFDARQSWDNCDCTGKLALLFPFSNFVMTNIGAGTRDHVSMLIQLHNPSDTKPYYHSLTPLTYQF
jgi:hypothetical protein